MIGELMKGQMHTFVESVPVKLKVTNFGRDLFGNEIGIEVTGDNWSAHGVVPSYVFDEEEEVAYGLAIGMRDELVLVSFPPTQGERTTMAVPENLLTKL